MQNGFITSPNSIAYVFFTWGWQASGQKRQGILLSGVTSTFPHICPFLWTDNWSTPNGEEENMSRPSEERLPQASICWHVGSYSTVGTALMTAILPHTAPRTSKTIQVTMINFICEERGPCLTHEPPGTWKTQYKFDLKVGRHPEGSIIYHIATFLWSHGLFCLRLKHGYSACLELIQGKLWTNRTQKVHLNREQWLHK